MTQTSMFQHFSCNKSSFSYIRVQEMAKGDESEYAIYFESAQNTTNLFGWSKEEIQELPECLAVEFRKMSQGLEKNWVWWKLMMDESECVEQIDYRDFVKCYMFVMTRCYQVDEITALVPFGDLMNHHHKNQTTFRMVRKRRRVSESESAKEEWLVIYAQMRIEEGEEVYNFFGEKDNDFLLLWYGFCYLDNEYDRLSLETEKGRVWVHYSEENKAG